MEKVYHYMDLPGCIGSMNVTHVQWGACPLELRHNCVGRYGYPTLGFNFNVYTIDVFNIYLVLSTEQSTILPSPTIIIILDD